MIRYAMTGMFLLLARAAAPQAQQQQLRPAGTFSIVARESVTGEPGVAVQPHWFSVRHLVPRAEAGVGAVAARSFVGQAYGPLGLELMKAGSTALRTMLTGAGKK